MSQPLSETTPTGTGDGSGGAATGNATLILVLGIVGILCCNLLGPVVWYMGKQELQGIAEGRIAAANEGTAKAGMILGIIGTCLLVGGMGILSAVLEQA
jgi:hypothetical protein